VRFLFCVECKLRVLYDHVRCDMICDVSSWNYIRYDV